MISVTLLKGWLAELPQDGNVCVDEGGLALIGLNDKGENLFASLEIGGFPMRDQTEDPCIDGHKGYSAWQHDAQGIPLCRTCERCHDFRMSKYRPEILSGYTQADVDEPIEPEEG